MIDDGLGLIVSAGYDVAQGSQGRNDQVFLLRGFSQVHDTIQNTEIDDLST